MKTLLSALVLVALSACGHEPPSGTCKGSIGDRKLDVTIDPSSEAHTLRPDSCAAPSRSVLTLKYGQSALSIRAVTEHIWAGTTQEPRPIPAEPGLSGFIEAWVVTAPSERPDFDSGEATFEFVLGGRNRGTFHMAYADGSRVDCTFDVPVDDALDEGPELVCGDPDGDDDWDD